MEKVLSRQPFLLSAFLPEAEDTLLQVEVMVDKLHWPLKGHLILTISFKKSFLCCFFKGVDERKISLCSKSPSSYCFFISVHLGYLGFEPFLIRILQIKLDLEAWWLTCCLQSGKSSPMSCESGDNDVFIGTDSHRVTAWKVYTACP